MAFKLQAPVPLFHVFDLEASILFYCRALNFELVAATEIEPDEEKARTWAMLQADDCTLMLRATHKSQHTVSSDPARVTHHADTILYVACADLEALCSHLLEVGVFTFRGTDTFPGTDQVFMKDPDGYVLCFQRPAATARMHD